MKAAYSAIGLSLLLAIGCGKKKSETTTGKDGGDAVSADAGGAPPAADAADAADAAAVPDTPAAAGGLSGRADGVGPLDEKFAVSKASLEKAFPGHTVYQVSKSHGEELLEEYWTIKKGETELLHVQAEEEDIDAVDILSDEIPNPLGVKLGATFADVEKALGKLSCENAGDEIDWRQHVVVCASPKAATYTIDFVSQEGEDASEMLADPAKLAKATVKAVTWRVPMPVPG